MDKKAFFSQVEKFPAPSTILFRSIELKLLKERLFEILKSRPILDLGCGEGISASAVFGKKIDYGLDNDNYFLRLARDGGIYQKLIFAEAEKIPLENQSLNLVFCNSTLEHIKDLKPVFSEIKRILKKNGYFLFTTPSDNFKNYNIFSYLGLKKLAKIYGQAREKKLEHHHVYSLEKWQLILGKEGFEVIDGYYYLDKKIIEFWDFLFLLNKFFSFLRIISRQFFFSFYQLFLKQRIYQTFLKAQVTDSAGAAVCLVAQKR